MEGQAHDPRVLRNAGRIKEGRVVVIYTDPHLGGDGNGKFTVFAGFFGGAHGGARQILEQIQLPGQGRAAALAGHLRGGAAEVQIDVIRPVFCHQNTHRFGRGFRLDPVELDGAHRIARIRLDHVHGLRVSLHEGSGGDHLAHPEPGGSVCSRPVLPLVPGSPQPALPRLAA